MVVPDVLRDQGHNKLNPFMFPLGGFVPTMGQLKSSAYNSRGQSRQHGFAICVAQCFTARPLGVRHHAKDIARCIAHPRNVINRSIRVEFILDSAIGAAIAE